MRWRRVVLASVLLAASWRWPLGKQTRSIESAVVASDSNCFALMRAVSQLLSRAGVGGVQGRSALHGTSRLGATPSLRPAVCCRLTATPLRCSTRRLSSLSAATQRFLDDAPRAPWTAEGPYDSWLTKMARKCNHVQLRAWLGWQCPPAAAG